MKKSAIKKFPGVRKRGSGKFVIDYIDHNNIRHQITFNGTEPDAIRVKKAFTIKRDRIKMGIELPPEKLIGAPSLSKLWTEFEQDKKLKIAGGSMKKISLDRYEDVKIAVKKAKKDSFLTFEKCLSFNFINNYSKIIKKFADDDNEFKLGQKETKLNPY